MTAPGTNSEQDAERRAGMARAATRPLTALTDEELHAIDTLSHHASILAPHLADPINALAMLAVSELADRELRETLYSQNEPAQEGQVQRFYRVAKLPLGATVHDVEDPARVGALVRRAARNWVDRDTKPPMVRWRGILDAEPIPWERIVENHGPATASEEPQS